MNLVDSCGWLEYFADGGKASFFAPAIEDMDRLIVPSLCLFEVFKRVLQQRSEQDALRAAAVMRQARVVDLNDSLALSADRLSVDCKLALADSIILCTARQHGATLWTQDAHFADLPDVRYVAK
ncbi:MAG: type II toxin-antitoxin system VapC family toxin [Candidatus Accumulibacter sp.]|uniref:VapC toxin protein n=1 Tax=Candidatus Accumulibacter phosphatis TaxID=327160 RepID=A0A5S4EL93_9PROT|nr:MULTISPECIES: type II toxin-antitoxin system VapC family toxin [Candidatus Accumulibacter]MBO3709900.1 type II toxin-antitoxin system VapC family toxin [Accumulibacter sp.]MCM8578473.1 type II toxin-antitoxin system VapC family toxin [Accumulibacter sp.]TMQ76099.1 VapC toxin protein [Candidatus Accumulibacter phosphatis]HNC19749.1 type II toxin-antitoxin system VapC family toxin [Accumulibacter sp.]